MNRLDAIRQREQAATEGPWVVARYRRGGGRIASAFGDRHLIADTYSEGDREFLFAARADVPLLLAAVEAGIEWRRAVLAALDHVGNDPVGHRYWAVEAAASARYRAALAPLLEPVE